MYSMYFDGACRGNPGPSSIGGVIYNSKKEEKITYKKAIGVATNNYAEYQALLAGIKICIQYNIKEVNVYGDSKLAIEQVNGNWKIKSETLKPIYLEIKKYITPEFFKKITFNHVRREFNKKADEMANLALDNI
jgi:ribonuclease HI